MNAKPNVSEFGSVDPAPPSNEPSVDHNMRCLIDENEKMFLRMRAVFALRNIGGKEAVMALARGFNSNSALLRHEIAYVLGQMQDSNALEVLSRVLSDESEHVMVRHEAAEALGAIGDHRALPILNRYLEHKDPEISESCEVAIDLLEFVSNSTKESINDSSY